jgi:hypothetical protein
MLLLNEVDRQNEDSLHNYVVLKVNICLEIDVLSRIKKGIEKYAAISLKLIFPITRYRTNKNGISERITLIL